MAFSASDASDSSRARRAMSIGPLKAQFMTYSCSSADSSGTVTADALAEASMIITDGGISLTSAPTYSGNAVTLAFIPPAAGIYTFTISSGNATVGSIYADSGGHIFSTAATVATAVSVTMNGDQAAAAASGTLTKIAGTGDATLTYSAVVSPSVSGDLVVLGV